VVASEIVQCVAAIDKEGGKPNIIRVLPPFRKMGTDYGQGKRARKTPTKQ
jgi:hypothetical protein